MGTPFLPDQLATFLNSEHPCYIPTSTCNDICFPVNTPIETDDGEILIQNIDTNNIIHGLSVKNLVKSLNTKGKLILIKQNAFGNNIPKRDTYITHNHGIYIRPTQFVRARDLVNNKDIIEVITKEKYVYNILLNEYSYIYVNDICCETLNPNFQKKSKLIIGF